MILSGEVEIISTPMEEDAGEDDYGDEDGYGAPHGGHPGAIVTPGAGAHGMQDEPEDIRGHPFAHNGHHNHPAHHAPHMGHGGHHALHLQTMMPRGGAAASPMIVQSPNTVSFENPAMASMYDPPHMGQYFPTSESPNNKQWQMGGGPGGFPQQQFTPPQTSHGVPAPQQTFNMPYGASQRYAPQGRGGLYGSPVANGIDNDDASSVGSAGHSPVPGNGNNNVVIAKRERSGSMGSVGSNGEMPSVLNGGMGRRGPQQGQWDEAGMGGYGMGMNGMGMGMAGATGGMGMGPQGNGMSGMGMGGRGASAAMSVVGGGGNAFGAMML